LGRPEDSQVRLAEFAAWALSVGWNIPDELKEIAATRGEPKPPPTDRPNESQPGANLTQRAELGYLKTIGALLGLLLKKSGPASKAPYPSQAAIIEAIEREYSSTSGL